MAVRLGSALPRPPVLRIRRRSQTSHPETYGPENRRMEMKSLQFATKRSRLARLSLALATLAGPVCAVAQSTDSPRYTIVDLGCWRPQFAGRRCLRRSRHAAPWNRAGHDPGVDHVQHCPTLDPPRARGHPCRRAKAGPEQMPLAFGRASCEHQCRPRAVAATGTSGSIVSRSMFLPSLLGRPI